MAKRPGEKRDFMQVAREVVEKDGSPLDIPPDTRDPHFVALGSKGGKKGGKARAKQLSSKRRSAIAKKAADARWKRSS
jgi:hypothetical protein